MSVRKLSFLLILPVFYALYESYNLRVDSKDFLVHHRRKINAESTQLFDFLVLTHVMEKWFPGTPRLKAADAKTLGVGKYFQAFFKLPLIGEWNLFMITTDYKRGKLIALESRDGILNPRFELRTDNYHDQTILRVTLCFGKSSALFHYTIGAGLRSIVQFRFEEAMVHIEEMYKATDKYRELTLPLAAKLASIDHRGSLAQIESIPSRIANVGQGEAPSEKLDAPVNFIDSSIG